MELLAHWGMRRMELLACWWGDVPVTWLQDPHQGLAPSLPLLFRTAWRTSTITLCLILVYASRVRQPHTQILSKTVVKGVEPSRWEPPVCAGRKALASYWQHSQQPGQDSTHRFKHSQHERCCISVSHRVPCWQRVRWLILSPRLFLEKENVSALEREKGSNYKKSYSLSKGALSISIKYQWNPGWLMIRGNSNGFMSLVVQYHPRTWQGKQRSAAPETRGAGTGHQRVFQTDLWVCGILQIIKSHMKKTSTSYIENSGTNTTLFPMCTNSLVTKLSPAHRNDLHSAGLL